MVGRALRWENPVRRGGIHRRRLSRGARNGSSLCPPPPLERGFGGPGGVSKGVGGLNARKNAAFLKGGVKNCGDDDGCATDRTNETIECTDKKAVDLEMGDAGEDIAANSSSDEEEAQSCGICLTPYEPRCQVTTATKSASCNHMFHSKCLMEWLQDNELCPYCRTPMMSPDELLEAATETLGKRRVAKLQREGLEEETN